MITPPAFDPAQNDGPHGSCRWRDRGSGEEWTWKPGTLTPRAKEAKELRKQAADRFFLGPATIAQWTKRVEEEGDLPPENRSSFCDRIWHIFGRIVMPKKRHTPEQIINKLREAEVLLSKGTEMPKVCRKLEVSEQTYYRWRKE